MQAVTYAAGGFDFWRASVGAVGDVFITHVLHLKVDLRILWHKE